MAAELTSLGLICMCNETTTMTTVMITNQDDDDNEVQGEEVEETNDGRDSDVDDGDIGVHDDLRPK